MTKKIKKGTKGPTSKYITRSKAIKKLDIPIKDFRKLCILKGIHPREPSKGVKNSNTTYYHLKDIKFLAQDQLMEYFRQIKTYRRKLHLAMKRQNKSKIEKLKDNKPEMNLKYIIKERYSEFKEALKDLDDPLSLIALVAQFPSHRLFKINPEKLQICKTLLLMFKSICVNQNLLKKTFLSIKGIDITWVEPYPFGQTLPFDVDYKVILSFIEFYTVLLKFTIFKLCKEYNIAYPLTVLQDLEGTQHNGNSEQFLNCQISQSQIIEEEFKTDTIIDKKDKKLIFKGYKFFLSREVNKEIFEFCIKNFGGEVFYDQDNFNSEFFKNNQFTHVIIDRPMNNIQKKDNTEYVQPQWVVDSINFEILLPVTDYMPGKKLPPHLSPFDKSKTKGFITQREKEILQTKGEYVEESIEDSEEEEMQQEDEKDVKKEVYDFNKEQIQKQKVTQERGQEEKKLSESMLTNKKKKLLDRIKNSNQKEKERILKLIKRRKQLKNNNNQFQL